MRRFVWPASIVALVACLAVHLNAEVPTPSPYPTTWELKFDHGTPTRVVVQVPGSNKPLAYWYMTYSVTNDTTQELLFLPVVEMLSQDLKLTRSDKLIPETVVAAIRKREGNKYLQGSVAASGEIRVGPAETKYAVAVWPETTLQMGQFSIFVGGLSGEYKTIKGANGKDVILRKNLQLNFYVKDDNLYPGEDEVSKANAESWVMR